MPSFGPFEGVDSIHGVTFDGEQIWFAAGDALRSLDPVSGQLGRSIVTTADAGTAFDGSHFYQLTGTWINKIDAGTGRVVGSIPAPAGGGSGLTWAEVTLWMGQHRDRKILQLDPETGAVLRTIESNRFVTGVTWVGG